VSSFIHYLRDDFEAPKRAAAMPISLISSVGREGHRERMIQAEGRLLPENNDKTNQL
jgi:hypothetical protein